MHSFIFMPNPYATAFAREEGKGVKRRRGLCRERRTGQDLIHSHDSRVQCAGGCRASGQRPTQAWQFYVTASSVLQRL